MENSASKAGKADKKKEDDAGLLYNKLRKLINIVVSIDSCKSCLKFKKLELISLG